MGGGHVCFWTLSIVTGEFIFSKLQCSHTGDNYGGHEATYGWWYRCSSKSEHICQKRDNLIHFLLCFSSFLTIKWMKECWNILLSLLSVEIWGWIATNLKMLIVTRCLCGWTLSIELITIRWCFVTPTKWESESANCCSIDIENFSFQPNERLN